MGALTWTDGALATTLQRQGLPERTPVEAWVTERPEAVAGVHRAFADAGARIVLAATFRCVPEADPAWAATIDRAVDLAVGAVGGRAAVWAPLGPGSVPWKDVPDRDRRRRTGGFVDAASRAVRRGAAGVVLETFIDPDEALWAVRGIRAAMPDVALVASLVPRPDGLLVDGTEPGPAIEALLGAGATGVGFNCGWGPAGVERALDRCEGIEGPRWAKPAAGETPDEEVVRALVRLAGRCAWVGGCCGVPPEVLAAAVTAVRPPSAPT